MEIMSFTLRIVLMVISIVTFFYVMRRINKARVKIEDSIFWIFFSIALLILGIFPEIIYKLRLVFGIADPTNCLFFLLIAALLIKVFSMSIKISQLESKIVELIQKYGIDHMDDVADQDKED